MLQNLDVDILGELVDKCDYETIKNLKRVNRDIREKLSQVKFQLTIQEKKVQHVRKRIFELVNEMFPEECEMEYNTTNSEVRCWKSGENRDS